MITIFRRLCGSNIALPAAGAVAGRAQLPSSQQRHLQPSNRPGAAQSGPERDDVLRSVSNCPRPRAPIA
jgi:hypothetical protein